MLSYWDGWAKLALQRLIRDYGLACPFGKPSYPKIFSKFLGWEEKSKEFYPTFKFSPWHTTSWQALKFLLSTSAVQWTWNLSRHHWISSALPPTIINIIYDWPLPYRTTTPLQWSRKKNLYVSTKPNNTQQSPSWSSQVGITSVKPCFSYIWMMGWMQKFDISIKISTLK